MSKPRSIAKLGEPHTICPECLKKLSRSRGLKRHMEESHGPPRFCPFGCKYDTVRAERLQNHLMNQHCFPKMEARALATSKEVVLTGSAPTVPKLEAAAPITRRDGSQINGAISKAGTETSNTIGPRVASPANTSTIYPFNPDGVQQDDNPFEYEFSMYNMYAEMMEEVNIDWNAFSTF